VSLREPFRSLLEPVALEEGASVFVSIHINAAEGGEGIEVWYNHFGKELAKAILGSNTVFEHVPSLVETGGSRSALYATCCCGVECRFSFAANSFSSR
jgi:hypothetical protein